MRYLLLAALRPPYCYCYLAASCLPVQLKPYTNWLCLGFCLTFLTGMVAAFASTQASFILPYKVTFKPDRRSQNSVSFAVKTLPPALPRV